MTKSELLAALARFPDDAVITTNGEDGGWCDDVNVESVDAPHCFRASDDKPVIFIRGYGPGNLSKLIPTVDDFLIMPDGERVRIRNMANEKFDAEVYRGACERGIIQWEPST